MLVFLLLHLVTLCSCHQVVLLTGGSSDGSAYLSTTEVLTLETNQESCISPALPSPRGGHVTALTTDNLLLTCGGQGNAGEDDLSCLVLDVTAGQWLPHSTLDRPRLLSSSVITPHGLLLLGGQDNKTTSSILQTGSTLWVPGPDIPGFGADLSCAVAISSSQFLLIGGAGVSTGGQVLEYNWLTEEWTEWLQLEDSRFGHSCLKLGDTVVVTGGYSKSQDLVLDLATKETRPGGVMQSGARRFFGTATLLDVNEVLAFGGLNDEGQTLNTVEELRREEDGEAWQEKEVFIETPRYSFGSVAAPRDSVCAV